MIITDAKGHKAEAFDLILKKDFAYQILTGQKTIEFRAGTDNYLAKFCTKEMVSDYKKGKKNIQYSPKEVFFVHFRDYARTWFMNVAIRTVDFIAMHEKNLDYLHDLKCFECDDMIAQNKIDGIEPNDERMQWFFALPIVHLVNTSLDTSKINLIRQRDIPEEFWL